MTESDAFPAPPAPPPPPPPPLQPPPPPLPESPPAASTALAFSAPPSASTGPVKGMWGDSLASPAGRRPLNSDMHWNWAAGCVVGLSALCLVLAGPRFAVAVDSSRLGQQRLGDWLLYGAALGGLLTVLCLASRTVAVVSVLSFATAAAAIAAVIKLQGTWTLTNRASWPLLAQIVGLGILGLAATAGLRRRA
jgi:hypothetical protein